MSIQNIDWAILHLIKSTLTCSALDFIMPKITMLANGGILWIAVAILMIISKKYRKYGVTMLIAMTVGLLTGNLLLKNIVCRPRPCWIESVPLLIKNPSDFSFPSGHTLCSVIASYIIFSANKKLGAAGIATAALIAFSRMYLYVHFPSDVFASVILGMLIAFLCLRCCRFICENKLKH